MSLFSLFKRSKSVGIEKELEDYYTSVHRDLSGTSPSEARRMVRDTIIACKQKGHEEGTSNLPENFGDSLLSQARERTPAALRIVEKARNEGATEKDIAEWWNLNDLQRRMVLWSEQVFRYANFLSFRDQGFDSDAAMRKVRQMFPMYGDPLDVSHSSGDDRSLPHELRGRVDEYRAEHGAAAILQRSSKYTTYNAFVRAEIRNGCL